MKKIIVINGSPKGEYSITLQYARFIEKISPNCKFIYFDVAHSIKSLDKNRKRLKHVLDQIEQADGILWIFGVYVLLVPSQLIRFIELIYEEQCTSIFKDKYTAVLSTSIHYYDHTAHNYMRGICEDLQMHYVDGISLDLIDLKKESKRQIIKTFAHQFFHSIENQICTSQIYKPVQSILFNYTPGNVQKQISPKNQTILVITDYYDANSNLGKMIHRFLSQFKENASLLNLDELDIKGGCLGCMKCGGDFKCHYKDEFAHIYNTKVRKADIIIFAGIVKHRFLSSKWKEFYDRAYFWNHQPSLIEKQMAYLISGPLSDNPNLIQYLEASVIERQKSNLVDIISDEISDSQKLDNLLENLAHRCIENTQLHYIKPSNFLAEGGHRIIRDNIWGRLRLIWQADYKCFKKSGFYDFPHKNLALRFMNRVVGILMIIPAIRKRFYKNITKVPSMRLKNLLQRLIV